jgi:3-keto steroid reductase
MRKLIFLSFSHSGVGYGICERLLLNFCGGEALDALPQPFASPGNKTPCEFTPNTRLTLIIACRNPSRASSAKANLLLFLDKHIEKHVKKHSKSDGHRKEHIEQMKEFGKNLEIDLLPLDLASIESTFEFCSLVYEK